MELCIYARCWWYTRTTLSNNVWLSLFVPPSNFAIFTTEVCTSVTYSFCAMRSLIPSQRKELWDRSNYLVVPVRKLASMNAAAVYHCLQAPSFAFLVLSAEAGSLLLLSLPVHKRISTIADWPHDAKVMSYGIAQLLISSAYCKDYLPIPNLKLVFSSAPNTIRSITIILSSYQQSHIMFICQHAKVTLGGSSVTSVIEISIMDLKNLNSHSMWYSINALCERIGR